LEQNKDYDKAEKTLLKLIKLDPKSAEHHFQLATLYDRRKQFSKAEAELKEAIAIKPEMHVALNYLGYSYADRNLHLDEAEKLINNAIALDPDNAAYLDSMGWVYYRQGRLQKAEDFLREATRHVQDPLIWEHLGDALEAKGEITEAVMAWDESLRLQSDQGRAKSKLEKAISKLSVRERCATYVKRAVNHFGDVKSVNGLINIQVCEKTPCFESNAHFNFQKDGEMRVEIPGPLGAPVLLLTKEHGAPAAYGAIHPLFQTVEYHVTRAFNRIESLLSGDVFSSADLATLQKTAEGKKGKLIAVAEGLRFVFNDRTGLIEEISWSDGLETEALSIGNYKNTRAEVIPATLQWLDQRTHFIIRLKFLQPVVSFVKEADSEPENHPAATKKDAVPDTKSPRKN
jgi:tetratricopeptide (TPR) repeat protein